MNPYEGLNLAQLLDLMHGLVVPAPVSWLPATPGWWIVCAWLVAVVLLLAWRLVLRHRRNRYRRVALRELRAIEVAAGTDPEGAAQAVANLIKRTALAVYPRRQVASLAGPDWARFLSDSTDRDPLVEQWAGQLAAAAYRPGVDARALLEPARRWIKAHRA
jgi:predicted negative regulator of RcsB-dependent stress response